MWQEEAELDQAVLESMQTISRVYSEFCFQINVRLLEMVTKNIVNIYG